jgi:hypothetical protein
MAIGADGTKVVEPRVRFIDRYPTMLSIARDAIAPTRAWNQTTGTVVQYAATSGMEQRAAGTCTMQGELLQATAYSCSVACQRLSAPIRIPPHDCQSDCLRHRRWFGGSVRYRNTTDTTPCGFVCARPLLQLQLQLQLQLDDVDEPD